MTVRPSEEDMIEKPKHRDVGRPETYFKEDHNKEPFAMTIVLKCPKCSVVFIGQPGLTPQPCLICSTPVDLQRHKAQPPTEEPEDATMGFKDVLARLDAVEVHNLAVDLAEHLLEALPLLSGWFTHERLAVGLAEAISTFASGTIPRQSSPKETPPKNAGKLLVPDEDLELVHKALQGSRGQDQRRIAQTGLDFVATILRKNRDYGSSVFEPPVLCPKLDAGTSILVRASDKVKRLATLDKQPPEVVSEAIQDTVKDLGAYCLLWLCRPKTPQWHNEEV